jgi:hypothetical protein
LRPASKNLAVHLLKVREFGLAAISPNHRQIQELGEIAIIHQHFKPAFL